MKNCCTSGLQKNLCLLILVGSTVVAAGGSGLSGSGISDVPPVECPPEIIADWESKDGIQYDSSIATIKTYIKEQTPCPELADSIKGQGESGYLIACHWRRVARLRPYQAELGKLLVAKHHDIGGNIVGYTEDLKGDGIQGLGDYKYPGMSRSGNYGSGGNSALYILTFTNYYPEKKVLMEDKVGVLRDPCPSLDGRKVVYAHAKDNDGYHIGDIDLETMQTRQLTDNLGALHVSDFEPCVLPGGDIIFNSSRCFGQVAHNINITSNLYLMNKDGKYMRRIGYDQAHTLYPTYMWESGTVMYSRSEFNDRNVATCLGIFTMNPDGSHQQEWFGNQTEWPATFNQACIIPGTHGTKAIATIAGHLGPYAGDLVLIDRTKGRNNIGDLVCTQLIAPRRELSGSSSLYDINGVPPENKLFQNPCPLDEKGFLVSFRKTKNDRFRVYWMDLDGNRELLAWDSLKSISQPRLLSPRQPLVNVPYQADYSKSTAAVAVRNVYTGSGVPGITDGIDKIRVAALEYRTEPAIGNSGAQTYQMTPVGRFGASWDAKWIVGEAKVASDGSAAFDVPPDVPLYFQLIDKQGVCVQTMRSWVSLRPGEVYECQGCHSDSIVASGGIMPIAYHVKGTSKPLAAFYDLSGTKGSFYYPKVIQPLLNANCVKSGCHNNTHENLVLTDTVIWTNNLDDADNNGCFRFWNLSYYNLSDRKYVNCNAIFGTAKPILPKMAGSAKSALITRLLNGHVRDLPPDVLPKLAAWIDLCIPHSGTYTDDMRPEDSIKYEARLDRRRQQEKFESDNIAEFVARGGYDMSEYRVAAGRGAPVKKQSYVNVSGAVADVAIISGYLSVRLRTAGSLALYDLAGRVVQRMSVDETRLSTDAHVRFPERLKPGIYVLRLQNGLTDECKMVTVVEQWY